MNIPRVLSALFVLLIVQSCCNCCTKNEKVATVERKQDRVQVGPQDNLQDVQTTSDLYNNESIKVTEGGKALVEFFSGSTELGWVTLYNDTQTKSVRTEKVGTNPDFPFWVCAKLSYGLIAIDTQSEGSYDFSVGKINTKILSTRALIAYDADTGYVSIGNFEGSVSWSYDGGSETEIPEGEGIDISADGETLQYILRFNWDDLDREVSVADNPVNKLMELRMSTGEPVPPPYAPPTPAPYASPTPDSSNGNEPSQPKMIRIAVQSPLSGSLVDLGIDIQRAADLAFSETRRSIENLGFQVELVVYDDGGNVDTGRSTASQIISDPTVLCGVGHLNSNVFLAASDFYHEGGLAFISPAATNPTAMERGYFEVNRVIGRDDIQGIASARYAAEEGMYNIVLSSEDNEYSHRIADAFIQEAQAYGMKVLDVSNIAYIYDPAGPPVDLVYGVGNPSFARDFFIYMQSMGYDGPLMGPDMINAPDIIGTTGDTFYDGIYFSTAAGPAYFYEGAATFMEEFQAYYGSSPQPFAVQTYDAMSICIQAIEKAVREKNNQIPSRYEVAQAIRNMGFSGITGYIQFNSNGELLDASYFIAHAYFSSGTQFQDVIKRYNISPP